MGFGDNHQRSRAMAEERANGGVDVTGKLVGQYRSFHERKEGRKEGRKEETLGRYIWLLPMDAVVNYTREGRDSGNIPAS
jgi:hypothetical protein